MKKNIYIALAFVGVLGISSCSDDDNVQGNPTIEINTEKLEGYFGDSIPFSIKASDVDVPLSTLKAQLYYGEEKVSETIIRTKENGADYTGKIYVPFEANIPNKKATVKYILQNIHFTTTEYETEIALTRPDFPYLTLVDIDGNEYKMDRISLYNYGVTDGFPRKMKAVIKAPKFGENGNELVFGWDNGAIALTENGYIPFSYTDLGDYEVTLNTLTFAASPFAKLLMNGKEMDMSGTDIYSTKLTINQGDILTFEGVPDYDNWYIDTDYFEKQADGTLKFLPLTGSYQLTANCAMSYFSVMALKDGAPARLQEDGTGAIWAIGDGIGKPSFSANHVGWSPEKGLCMSQMAAKKYQITLTVGETLKNTGVNFKFFYLNAWNNGEFKGDMISTAANEFFEIAPTDGNVLQKADTTLPDGATFRFTVDVTQGNSKAVLTIEQLP